MSLQRLRDIFESASGGRDSTLNFLDIESKALFWAPSDSTIIGPPTSGHPEGGDWKLNEIWIDSLGAIYRCVTAGSPGTWRQVVPAVVTTLPAGTIPTGYELVHDNQGRRRFRYNGSGWDRINRHRHNQVAPATTWPVAHSFGYKPSSYTIVIAGRNWMSGITHTDDNNFTVKFDIPQSGELFCE